MNWKRVLGLDTLRSKYAYGHDPLAGYLAAEKIPERWVPTTCGYCSVGCGMLLGVRDGHAVSVRGDDNHPVNRGKLCPKGLSEHYTIAAENRARYPLLRRNGRLERVAWPEALATMVQRFQGVQLEHGPAALGIISTGQLVTEEFYALGKLARLGFATPNYDGNTTLCMASAVAGYKRSFGSDGPPGAYQDLEVADVVLLIGANIADNHPILCQHLERNRAAKVVIVADPRVTKTAGMADLHLPLKPHSDIALLNAMAHVLIAEDLVDHGYIARHTHGFEALRDFVASHTPAYAATITGLSPEQIRTCALLYGRARAPFIGWTMGVNHSFQGAETVSAINNLALLTGQIGKPGASPFSITGQCNAMGTREAGFTSSMPGYRKFDDAVERAELAALWNLPESRLPRQRGLAYPDIIEAAAAGKVRALWIIATNPVVSFPNLDVLQRAFRNLEFLVVQDGFHPTPTSELADLVLPAAIWGEKEGTYTNSERRVSKVNCAVRPPSEALPDFDIFLSVAHHLGRRQELFPGWTTPRDAFEEWKRVSAGRLCDYSGLSYELLEKHGGVQWPFTPGSDPTRPSRLYDAGLFATPDGRAELFCVAWQPFPEQPNQAYPFILNTGRTVEHWHTRTKTGRVPQLEALAPNAWLEMNPRDAARLSLRPHQSVAVISRRGRVPGIELRVTEIVAPGQVFMPFHFAETNANIVTQSSYCPISREPNYKQCAVRVEPSEAVTWKQ